MFNATLAGGTSSKYTLRADYLRDSRSGWTLLYSSEPVFCYQKIICTTFYVVQ